MQCKASRQQPAARRSHRVVAEAATQTAQRTKVPAELEKGDLPMNTFNNKKPFKATVKSVERIVGPKATGETCHIVIETRGEIPYWEGQSYGVIPPVRQRSAKLSVMIVAGQYTVLAFHCNAICVSVLLMKAYLHGVDTVAVYPDLPAVIHLYFS